MKQMIFADYASIKGILWQQILLSIIVALFVAFMTGNPFIATPMIGVMIPLFSIITLIAYDERNGWDSYRLTLPLSRTQTVIGRYAFIFIMTCLSILLGLIIHSFLVLGMPVWNMLPLEQFTAQLAASNAQALSVVVVAPLVIALCMASIVFPLSFRFGTSKAIRWIPLLAIVLFIGASTIVEHSNPEAMITFIGWMAIPTNTTVVLAVGAIGCCVIYAMSSVLSVYLYQTHEL